MPTSESPAPSIHHHVAVRKTPAHIPHWGARHAASALGYAGSVITVLVLSKAVWISTRGGVWTRRARERVPSAVAAVHASSPAGAGAGDVQPDNRALQEPQMHHWPRMRGGICMCGTWRCCWIRSRRTSAEEELVDAEVKADADAVGEDSRGEESMLDSRASRARVLGARDAARVRLDSAQIEAGMDPVCAGCEASLTGLGARTEVSRNREGTGRDRQAARIEAGRNGG
ncbi:hypothetical protein C8R44DRAFT_846922 [Mycena epipterygia]|nr:hypothetical protein C8R44DRAFT_846922 [Mycena epipterygia]